MRIWKNLLDRQLENGSDPIGKIEGRVVPLGLERVDRLARDADQAAQLLLAPAALGAKHPEAALQGRELWINGVTIPSAPQKKG